KEINVIAQDTSRYGEDLYKKPMLPALLKELCKIDGIKWVRIFYCYPERITDELLEVIRDEEKIVKYLDIPIQHASGRILKLMNRFGDFEYLKNLVAKIRNTVPNICLRTTLIAGFPSETEEDINTLCDFVKETRFERLGCFAFSPEEGTPAVKLPNQLEEQLRIERSDLVMREQMNVSYELSQKMIGRELLILAEGYDEENDIYFGRSYMDAPDIDTKTFFTSKTPIEEGTFCKVIVEKSDGYDLLGHAIETDGEL
ncbi:MAG: radical SAM protein, partial [Oscillospiraceae bacterium]